MSLMFPPRQHRASAIAPVTMKRPFRIAYECTECQMPSSLDLMMLDEVHDAATELDVLGSGAIDEIDATCSRCGCGQIAVTSITYLRQPTDGPRE